MQQLTAPQSRFQLPRILILAFDGATSCPTYLLPITSIGHKSDGKQIMQGGGAYFLLGILMLPVCSRLAGRANIVGSHAVLVWRKQVVSQYYESGNDTRSDIELLV